MCKYVNDGRSCYTVVLLQEVTYMYVCTFRYSMGALTGLCCSERMRRCMLACMHMCKKFMYTHAYSCTHRHSGCPFCFRHPCTYRQTYTHVHICMHTQALGASIFISDVQADEDAFQQNISALQSNNNLVVVLYPSHAAITLKEAYTQDAHTPSADTQENGTHAQSNSGFVAALSSSSMSSQEADSDSRQNNTQEKAPDKDLKRPERDLIVIVLDGTWTQANSLNRRVAGSIQRVKLGESVCVDVERAEDASPLRKQKVIMCRIYMYVCVCVCVCMI
jgi:hypothetical protein